MHIPEAAGEYATSNRDIAKAFKKDKIRDTLYLVNELVKKMKVVIFDGQFDLYDGPTGIQEWMKKMDYEHLDEFEK